MFVWLIPCDVSIKIAISVVKIARVNRPSVNVVPQLSTSKHCCRQNLISCRVPLIKKIVYAKWHQLTTGFGNNKVSYDRIYNHSKASHKKLKWGIPFALPSLSMELFGRQTWYYTGNTNWGPVSTVGTVDLFIEVGFNTIMYYVLRQPAQWEDQCSLTQGHWAPSQYPRYRAIGRYVRFYVVYVKFCVFWYPICPNCEEKKFLLSPVRKSPARKYGFLLRLFFLTFRFIMSAISFFIRYHPV